MLSCDQALELISARLDGPLTREETETLEAHLSACPACRALSDELEQLHQELPALAVQHPARLKDGVMGRIRESKVTPFQSKKSRWRWRSLASLAAVAVLALVAAGSLDQWREHGMLGSGQDAAAPAAAEAMTDQTGGSDEQSAGSSAVGDSRTERESEPLPAGDDAGGGTDGQSKASPSHTPQTGAAEPAVPRTVQQDGDGSTGQTTEAQTVEPAQAGAYAFAATPDGLTGEQALLKLAAWLGWDTEGLTVAGDGTLSGPTAADGTASRLICAGLNEVGTGWLCQLEQIAPGPDGAASCTSYTVPLDGSDITQP